MLENLFYLSNVAIIGYLAFAVYKQIVESNKTKKLKEWAQSDYETAKYEMDTARQDHLTLIKKVYSPIYGEDIVEQIKKRVYFEGMPMILLFASLGRPNKIQEGNYKGVSVSKFYYGEDVNRLGNPVYDIEITLENFVVVGWKDLR